MLCQLDEFCVADGLTLSYLLWRQLGTLALGRCGRRGWLCYCCGCCHDIPPKRVENGRDCKLVNDQNTTIVSTAPFVRKPGSAQTLQQIFSRPFVAPRILLSFPLQVCARQPRSTHNYSLLIYTATHRQCTLQVTHRRLLIFFSPDTLATL